MKAEAVILEAKKVEAEDQSKRIRQLAGRASKELQQNKQLEQKTIIADLTEAKDNLTKQYKGNKIKDLEAQKIKILELEKERERMRKNYYQEQLR